MATVTKKSVKKKGFKGLEVIYRPVGDLTSYETNSRTHTEEQIRQIMDSMTEFGWTNPILVDEANMIIAGHGRVMAAIELKQDSVPCIQLTGLTPEQKRAYVIADNKLALNAGWDEEMLSSELLALQEDGFTMSLIGFEDEELRDLIALSGIPPAEDVDPDAIPELQGEAVSKEGDIWLLGKHRLSCGDSTSTDVIQALLGGKMADAMWTDPPYNVAYGKQAQVRNDYNGSTGGNTSTILNDDMDNESFYNFLLDFYTAAWSGMKEGAALYVSHSETERANFTVAMLNAGFKLSGLVVWKKEALVLGRSDYQWIHEPVLYGWKKGAAHKWFGGRKQTTVMELGSKDNSPFIAIGDGKWQITIGDQTLVVSGTDTVDEVQPSVIEMNKPKRNDVHPTMKPVALIERMLKNSAKAGYVIIDPFGGSGSTLIACERLGMHACINELSPHYVDVIIRRWQEYSGGVATHAVTGASFPT